MNRFAILFQVDPPEQNAPFVIQETILTSEGWRTRVVAGRHTTFEGAKGEVEALQAALAKQEAAQARHRAAQDDAARPLVVMKHDGPPPPPWPPGEANAMRHGWFAFFKGEPRDKSGFPPNRHGLHRDYAIGWDAAKESQEKKA
jgi:hypothetical protein